VFLVCPAPPAAFLPARVFRAAGDDAAALGADAAGLPKRVGDRRFCPHQPDGRLARGGAPGLALSLAPRRGVFRPGGRSGTLAFGEGGGQCRLGADIPPTPWRRVPALSAPRGNWSSWRRVSR